MCVWERESVCVFCFVLFTLGILGGLCLCLFLRPAGHRGRGPCGRRACAHGTAQKGIREDRLHSEHAPSQCREGRGGEGRMMCVCVCFGELRIWVFCFGACVRLSSGSHGRQLGAQAIVRFSGDWTGGGQEPNSGEKRERGDGFFF